MLYHFDVAGIADESCPETCITTVGRDGLDIGAARQIHSSEDDSSVWQSWQKGQCNGSAGPIAATAHMRHVLNCLLESNLLHA